MAAAEDMTEHAATSDTETGFGTGLRAKLGRPTEGEPEAAAPPAPGEESFAPPLPATNGGASDADVEALRGALAAALARERALHADLQAALSERPTVQQPAHDFGPELASRTAELDERA